MNTPVIGQPLGRVEGPAKVQGHAQYAADFNQPHQAYAVIVTSSVGLGRITRIDDAVLDMPGMIALISYRNAPRLPYNPHKGGIDPAAGERLHVLQDDRVHFYGQPVAIVVAKTLDQAERAAAAVRITYEKSEPVIELRDSLARAVIPEVGRRPGRLQADKARGDADGALVKAPRAVDVTYEMARENHNPIEPHATVASWNGDRLTVWSKSQFVVNEQQELAAIFGMKPEDVQVICPFIGGAFGTSLRTWPHVTLAAIAAKHVARPVKLVLTRRQMFFATGGRPRTIQRVALGATEEGRLLSLTHEGTGETSRYEQFIEALTAVSQFMYSCQNAQTRYRIVPLDTSTPNHMRGPGEASGIYALECAMDELAYLLRLDPVELRRRNEPTLDESENRPFSSRALTKCFEQAGARFGWSRRNPIPRSMRDGRLLIGWGTAAATYPAIQSPASARARLYADGSADVEAAASDMGPGTYTSMTQVAADALGLSVERVRFRLGRSDFPPTPPHGGSQTMASVGSAVRAACLSAREKAGEAASENGGSFVEATASVARDPAIAQKYSTHAFGAVFVEVSVDPDLGIVRVRRVVGAYDVGRVVNPRLARSQCIGGIVGGIGMALMERTVLDPRDGRPVNAHLADYLVPVNLDIQDLEALFIESDDPYVNPLGVKGLGEIALIGVAPAIANAVFHATGLRVRSLPIRVEDLLHEPEQVQSAGA